MSAKTKTRKKTQNALLNVVLVWDMSGSMGAVWDAAIEGANDYLHTLREDENVENMRFSLTVFDTVFERWYKDVHLSDIPKITRLEYRPRGNTALNDAVADAIATMDGRLVEKRSDERVLIVVLTDGQENSSQEYAGYEGTQRLASLIRDKERSGRWTFVYLGVGSPEAVTLDAAKYNISAGNAAAYAATPESTGVTFAMVSAVTSTLGGSSSGSTRSAMADAGFKSVLEQESETDQND